MARGDHTPNGPTFAGYGRGGFWQPLAVTAHDLPAERPAGACRSYVR